jgi:hypothetical protein
MLNSMDMENCARNTPDGTSQCGQRSAKRMRKEKEDANEEEEEKEKERARLLFINATKGCVQLDVMYSPVSIAHKMELENTLFHLEIAAKHVSRDGWIAFDVQYQHRPHHNHHRHKRQQTDDDEEFSNDIHEKHNTTSFLILSYHQTSELSNLKLTIEARLVASCVFPIYLYGKLVAWGTTVWSTLRLSTQNGNHSSTPSPIKANPRVKVPHSMKNTCKLYIAWKVINLYALKSKLLLKSGAVSGLKADELISGVEALAEKYRLANAQSQGSSSIQSLVLLPHQDVSIEEEYRDETFGSVYTYRNGHDADWLCSQLPQVQSICSFAKYFVN